MSAFIGPKSAATGANADITSMTGLTGTLKAPTAVLDTNGKEVLTFAGILSASSYLEASNSTIDVPTITAKGSSANINVRITPKGTGDVALTSLASTTLKNNNTYNCRDDLFTIQDNGDQTKQARFQCSSISTATIQTYTLQNVSGILAIKTDVQVFTAPGTWNRPSWATITLVVAIGSGGGGGSGQRNVAGNASGGGGGSGGGRSEGIFGTQGLPATVSVTTKSGGTGAAAQTFDFTNGYTGGNGVTSSFGSYVFAGPGLGGPGGGLGGYSSGGNAQYLGGAGGLTGGFPGQPGGSASRAGSGGGSGGSNVGAVPTDGGAGGTLDYFGDNSAALGGVAPGGAGIAGYTAGASSYTNGGGGSGGACGTAVIAGGNGGAGGDYGAGGGGGGGSLNGANSGAGGDGGLGVVLVISY